MSSILFLALQCCQCSTMQVKQRKKNSNSHKWSCVVCNQSQSIRKVFAEGPMAKDLRLFVQSFNMSHHSHSSQPLPTATAWPFSHGSSKRPRSDWTEFLDPEEEIPEPDPKPSIDFEAEIITELPGDEQFKRAKPNKYGGQDELYKPVFPKRTASKEVVFKKKEVDDEDNKKPRKCQVLKGKEASKWLQYLAGDDNDHRQYPDDTTADDLLENMLIEELVEDDEIHPDFL